VININVEMQVDADIEGGSPEPLTFGEIDLIRNTVDAPMWATVGLVPADYGWSVQIHWEA
jgi:hypothetical protein